MDEPRICSICNQPLRSIKHPVAHEHHFRWDAEVRTCPHNLLSENHFSEPRHDEWHRSESGWVRREP